jgi:hypothetical protein
MYPIRDFLAKQEDVAESVSARTVLNVNRIYLQERLIQVQSPLALKINGMIPKEPLKTFGDSILNFINGLPEQLKSDFFTDNPNYRTKLNNATSDESGVVDFIEEFQTIYKIDPLSGEPI